MLKHFDYWNFEYFLRFSLYSWFRISMLDFSLRCSKPFLKHSLEMCDAGKTSTLLSFFLPGKMTSSLPTPELL